MKEKVRVWRGGVVGVGAEDGNRKWRLEMVIKDQKLHLCFHLSKITFGL